MTKIIIDEEPSCKQFIQKQGLKNFIKSTVGIVVMKNMKKNVLSIVFRTSSCSHSHP